MFWSYFAVILSCKSTVFLDCFHCAARRTSELQWPTWHRHEAPGWVPALLGLEACSSRGAPASHCCLPLKHSCLSAVEWNCKTKAPFVLLVLWMCLRRVETQLAAQRWGFRCCNCAAVCCSVDKLVLGIFLLMGQKNMTLLKPSSVESSTPVIKKL